MLALWFCMTSDWIFSYQFLLIFFSDLQRYDSFASEPVFHVIEMFAAAVTFLIVFTCLWEFHFVEARNRPCLVFLNYQPICPALYPSCKLQLLFELNYFIISSCDLITVSEPACIDTVWPKTDVAVKETLLCTDVPPLPGEAKWGKDGFLAKFRAIKPS